MTWVKSTHTLKFGADYRVQQLNQFQQNSFMPAFQFNNQMTSINPLRLDTNSGVPFASFLLGNMASASVAKSEWTELVAVGLFGLHPVSAETVNDVIQRGDLPSTLSVVAALAIHVRHTQREVASGFRRTWRTAAYLAP